VTRGRVRRGSLRAVEIGRVGVRVVPAVPMGRIGLGVLRALGMGRVGRRVVRAVPMEKARLEVVRDVPKRRVGRGGLYFAPRRRVRRGAGVRPAVEMLAGRGADPARSTRRDGRFGVPGRWTRTGHRAVVHRAVEGRAERRGAPRAVSGMVRGERRRSAAGEPGEASERPGDPARRRAARRPSRAAWHPSRAVRHPSRAARHPSHDGRPGRNGRLATSESLGLAGWPARPPPAGLDDRRATPQMGGRRFGSTRR
jgi:hypothetical protein